MKLPPRQGFRICAYKGGRRVFCDDLISMIESVDRDDGTIWHNPHYGEAGPAHAPEVGDLLNQYRNLANVIWAVAEEDIQKLSKRPISSLPWRLLPVVLTVHGYACNERLLGYDRDKNIRWDSDLLFILARRKGVREAAEAAYSAWLAMPSDGSSKVRPSRRSRRHWWQHYHSS